MVYLKMRFIELLTLCILFSVIEINLSIIRKSVCDIENISCEMEKESEDESESQDWKLEFLVQDETKEAFIVFDIGHKKICYDYGKQILSRHIEQTSPPPEV